MSETVTAYAGETPSRISVVTGDVRPVYWDTDHLVILDQRQLPLNTVYETVKTVEETVNVIQQMVVRGAPAIGATGAYGMVLAGLSLLNKIEQDTNDVSEPLSVLIQGLQSAKSILDAARPTAVNLMWATARILKVATAIAEISSEHGLITAERLVGRILEEAHKLYEQDVIINQRIGNAGAELLSPGSRVIHHCNTGALATVDVGTALGVIYSAHQKYGQVISDENAKAKNVHLDANVVKQSKKGIFVWVDETRPRLQGARLTAYELMRAGIPMRLMADNAAGLVLRSGLADAVLFGADRVAANGDVANKIGTYKLAVCAHENQVPVYACVPTSTIDLDILTGNEIPIEQRSADEVAIVDGARIAPLNVPVFNPAFDVTPAKYLTAIITEEGVCYPPFEQSLRKAKEAAEIRIEQEWKKTLEALTT